MEKLNSQSESLITFKEIKVSVMMLIVNLNKTNFTNSLEKSLLLNINEINFLFEKDTKNIKLNVNELCCGSIEIRQIVNFLNSKQVILHLRSTIIDLFDLNLDINMKERRYISTS